MASQDLRQRNVTKEPAPETGSIGEAEGEQPGGEIKHGPYEQAVRIVLLILYFIGSCVSIHVTQFCGAWLYFYDRDWYYAWMAVTKQHFGLLIVTMQQWWSPVSIRVSWHEDLNGQLRQTEDGRLETDFPERMILMANHQIYSDWLYLWWIAYTSKMHGHIFIILKESLKWIPLLGPGMQFFSFIFMTRKWEADKPRLQHRLQKLVRKHVGPEGKAHLDPMWLLIFPEGTNLSGNTRKKSVAWSEKQGIPDIKHALLPRSTGLFFCLQELKGTVDYIYDCTIAYENVPRNSYAQDLFTLRGMYFQGRRPPSVNLYWRRFAISELPLDDAEAFSAWVLERWREKDALLEGFLKVGRFPFAGGIVEPSKSAARSQGLSIRPEDATNDQRGFIETDVRPRNKLEFLQVFVPCLALLLLLNVASKLWSMLKIVISSR